jgi:predicted transcriptional regulator
MTKKITKREMFTMMMEKYNFTEEERAFIEHEIELLDKKKSGERKPTATQIANETLKEIIMEVLNSTEEMLTVTDIIKSHADLAELSNQKVSALMTQLKDAGRVEKVVEKRKSYFKAI